MNPNPQIGSYTLQSNLGHGGMADVYLAMDNANRWPVALKLLRGGADKDGKLQKRFEREAAALMKLRHSHIVQIYDTGRTADGRAYIAMEYVGGGDLAALLERAPGGKLPVSEAVYLMRRVAGAIAYAHGQGVIHRDLKPSNILLRADTGEPVVVDLGIASLAGAKPLTGTMESLGTPQYMAPEQGSDGARADGRADVYAIGVMLHELLTGQTPFPEDSSWSLLLRKQSTDAPSILTLRRDLEPRLAAVVDTCLRRDPAKRYQTAAALAAALDAHLPAGAGPPAPRPVKSHGRAATPRTPSDAGRRTPASTGSSPLLWTGGAAILLGLLLLALFLISGGGGGGGTQATADDPPLTTGAEVASGDVEDDTTAEPGAPTSTLAGPLPVAVIEEDSTPEDNVATPSRTRTPAGATTGRVTRDVYTRAGPGLAYPIDGGLSGGDVVPVLARDARGDWFLVNSATGPVWISKGYLGAVTGSLTAVEMAATIPALPTATATPPLTPQAAIPSSLPAITLLEPRPAACPPGPGAPSYSANDTIAFRWQWPGELPPGAYLEVRAGLVGRVASQGRADQTTHRQGDVWTFPVSGSAIFNAGDGAYQWAVYLIDASGRAALNSAAACFGLLGAGPAPTEEPPTAQPPTDTPNPTPYPWLDEGN